MNSESFSEGNQPVVSPVNSIGSRLKRAREELRLTITDIARQLRLTEERIVSLESDNYENMPGMTFVKGYLRSYARLVNLPADELILDFERLNLVPETKTLILTSHRQPVFLSNKSLRWLIYLISIGLLILAATWWSSSANNDATNLSSTELKHQSVKNISPTADTSAANNPVNAANVTANTAVNTQAAKSGAETNAANPASAPTAAAPKTNLSAEQEATSAASQQLPTTSAGLSSSDSAQTSDKQIKAESSTDGSANEDNEEVKPRKKPATRSHSRAQFDEPFDDE